MIGGMTERSPTGTEREFVCPFVAYDEDRDFRASVPDHRHRCFAESPAASRALAHQAAYCLSPAFAGCPTFIDWARPSQGRADPDAPGGADRASRGRPILPADQPAHRAAVRARTVGATATGRVDRPATVGARRGPAGA
jgi:hypothetical protein